MSNLLTFLHADSGDFRSLSTKSFTPKGPNPSSSLVLNVTIEKRFEPANHYGIVSPSPGN